MFRSLITAFTLVSAANAVAHDIDVGEGASLSFSPDTLTAAVGDTLNFHFYSGSGGHSVVSGPFSSPCQPSKDGFFSGYIKGDDKGDQTFVVTVNSTDPIWFYCSLGPHCISGMVGVVNPPSGQTVSSYVEAASGKKASAPAALQGGVLTTIVSGSGSGSSSGSVTSSPTGSSTGSSSSASGVSAETTLPTTTGSKTGTPSSAAATTGKTSSTSGGVAATSTPSGGGKNKDVSVMLGLGVGVMGFVALLA